MARPKFVRQHYKNRIFAVLLVAVLGGFALGQTNVKARQQAFISVSDSSPTTTTEFTRPRYTTEKQPAEPEKPLAKVDPNDNKTPFTANTVLVASNSLITEFERTAFDFLNRKRQENGLPPIAWNDEMARIARLHSENMARFKFFSHVGIDGLMVNDRADSLGISNWQAIGENIAFNRGYDKPAEFACEGWLKSPTHRDNILNRRWKETGVGVAVSADGSYYFTQVFVVR